MLYGPWADFCRQACPEQSHWGPRLPFQCGKSSFTHDITEQWEEATERKHRGKDVLGGQNK